MTDLPLIEKGVPYNEGRKRHGNVKYGFERLEAGDSILVADGTIARVSAAARKFGERYGRVMMCRSREGGVRVWRVE